MKKEIKQNSVLLKTAIIGIYSITSSQAVTFDDIQFWIGSGTNQAALVIEWKQPEVKNNTSVRSLVCEKTMVWGYRWNGDALAIDMFNAVVKNDENLFAVASPNDGYGVMLFGIGYDLNHNRLYGTQNGTEILSNSALKSVADDIEGVFLSDYSAIDQTQSLDVADLYWGGCYGPAWDTWVAYDLETSPSLKGKTYWTPDDMDAPWTGKHGEWEYGSMGLSGTEIKDGSWIGLTIGAGGFDYTDPTSPGTLAYCYHKHAPSNPQCAPVNAKPYPYVLVDATEPFANSALYSNPEAVLGELTTWATSLAFFGGATPFRTKIIEAAYNLDLDGNNTILTLDEKKNGETVLYGSVVVRFDHPVEDDPANPYGIDFLVYGNTFYVGKGYVSDNMDLRNYCLTGNAFEEPLKVSVSPDGINWYTYNDGPYCDSVFPTQAFEWDSDCYDSTGCGWTKKRMDFTKPVNPAVKSYITSYGGNICASDVLKLYSGSGGGTGFDLKESGFSSINYIKVEASEGFSGGELDAFSDVRPAMVGEKLLVVPENISEGKTKIFFNDLSKSENRNFEIDVKKINTFAEMGIIPLWDDAAEQNLPEGTLKTLNFIANPVLAEDVVEFEADLKIPLLPEQIGENVLSLKIWDGQAWIDATLPIQYHPDTQQVTVSDISSSSMLALVDKLLRKPELSIQFDGNIPMFTFEVQKDKNYWLERSDDFTSWEEIVSYFADQSGKVTLRDENPLKNNAFYRLKFEK